MSKGGCGNDHRVEFDAIEGSFQRLKTGVYPELVAGILKGLRRSINDAHHAGGRDVVDEGIRMNLACPACANQAYSCWYGHPLYSF